jgi:3',5'-cyclic AMP phosphodiesterase CpdA
MRIVQITDSHVSAAVPSRAADLERCIAHVNALDPKPDVVVHTGDVAHDGLAEEYASARRLLARLTAPCFVIPGNRDRRAELIRAFADGEHIHEGMEFVQYSVERFPVRLVLLDTLSIESNKGRLCPARLAHLDAMLATDTARPAVVFMHHPPFAALAAPDPYQYEDWAEAEALAAVLARHGHVRRLICGHIHRMINSEIGGVPASALTCMATDLRKGKPVTADPSAPIVAAFSVA